MTEFSLSATEVEGHPVISVVGDLDFTTCHRLAALARTSIPCGSRAVVDLSGLTFLDTSGLHTLVTLWKWLTRDGGNLVLAGPDHANARALWVTGLATRIPCTADVDAALGTFCSAPREHQTGRAENQAT
jgi:anti-anti-sigma factor